MNPMKRLGLVAVFVVGVGILGSTTAWAKPYSVAIEFTNVGDEPQASGVASFTVLKVESERGLYWFYVNYSGTLTVWCGNLTPGATYRTPAGTFTADATGAGSASAKVTLTVIAYEGGQSPCIIDVVRLNPDDSSTTVLTGEFWGGGE